MACVPWLALSFIAMIRNLLQSWTLMLISWKSCQMFGKKWLKLSHALCFIVVLVWSFFSPLKQISYLKKHIHLLARQIDVQSFLWLVPVRLRCCWNKTGGSFDFFFHSSLNTLKNVSLFSRKASLFLIPISIFFLSRLINATAVNQLIAMKLKPAN